MTRQHLWVGFFWSFLCCCTWLLLVETTPKTPLIPHFDKVLHSTGFLVLSYMAIKAYPSKLPQILACMAAYAASTEILQGVLTLTREASVLDFFADSTGIGLAFLVTQLIKKRDELRV